ncbi:MAG: DNA-directed RNA polymerase subunit omega [Candidatus Omnitrophica bacterium]|nr:DNA-directed RNA polymerase subunit omega [Candidatus Omnitrophota bacterium]
MPVPMEELLKNTNSYYKLVLAAAQRANELVKGMPSVVVPTSKKPAVVALEEIAKGKIHCEDTKDAKAKKSKE